MALLTSLAILSVSLFVVQAQPQQGGCETGQIEIEPYNGPDGPVRQCLTNPCFGGNNPCLGGGTCTPIRISFGSPGSVGFTYSTSCSCNAPYVATNVMTQIGGGGGYNLTTGFCVIPDADPCSPNPCFSPGICRPLTDGISRPGFSCSCPNFRGISPLRCASPFGPAPGSQGVCGTGAATDFPNRCYFNNDPQGRYVCCDNAGCNGFNADNLTPDCANNGYVPPGFGVSGPPANPPPSTPPSGPQGVCGTGGAADFPTRCYFNDDPQGRYVCCDKDGCDGFNPPDYLFPHCKTNGYVPPGYDI
jgi:hypothetical protein